MAPSVREIINRDLLDELRILTILQTEELWPSEKRMPEWDLSAPIPESAVPILKDLLLEILQGVISPETLTAIDEMGDLEVVPEPYRDLLDYAQYAHQEGKDIASDLLYNLWVTIELIKKMRA